MTFLKELMIIIILKREQSYAKIIDTNLKKIDDFSLSQKIGLVCKSIKSYQKYYEIFSSIYLLAQVLTL